MTDAWKYHDEPPQDVFPGIQEIICQECGEPSASGYYNRQQKLWVCEDPECVEAAMEEEE